MLWSCRRLHSDIPPGAVVHVLRFRPVLRELFRFSDMQLFFRRNCNDTIEFDQFMRTSWGQSEKLSATRIWNVYWKEQRFCYSQQLSPTIRRNRINLIHQQNARFLQQCRIVQFKFLEQANQFLYIRPMCMRNAQTDNVNFDAHQQQSCAFHMLDKVVPMLMLACAPSIRPSKSAQIRILNGDNLRSICSSMQYALFFSSAESQQYRFPVRSIDQFTDHQPWSEHRSAHGCDYRHRDCTSAAISGHPHRALDAFVRMSFLQLLERCTSAATKYTQPPWPKRRRYLGKPLPPCASLHVSCNVWTNCPRIR